MELLRDQRGQTTIVMGLAILSLCGMAGFAVDVGTLFRAKRVLQSAADAGAIAGAAEYNFTTVDGTTVTAAVDAATAQNGVTDGSNGYTVTVNSPPLSGPHTGVAGYVEVIASQSAPTYFMRLFHLSSMMVDARAAAGLGAASGCIYTLDTSGTDVGLSGSANISIPDCGVVVDSAASNAVTLSGSAKLQAESVGIVGGYSTSGSSSIQPAAITGLAPVPNPLSFLSPPTYTPSSCLTALSLSGSNSSTIGPSVAGGTVCYKGITTSGSSSLTLNPGVYVVTGALSASGSSKISGTGVTIYLAAPNGSLSLSGSAPLNLTAPTSGTYNGILIYEDPNDTKSISMSGSSSSDVEGIVYAPSAALSISGSSGSSFKTDLVVADLSISGSGTIGNYASVNPGEPLTSARIVE